MTLEKAFLFTDGRYFLQAEKQLDGYEILQCFTQVYSFVQELDVDEARSAWLVFDLHLRSDSNKHDSSDVPTWKEFLHKVGLNTSSTRPTHIISTSNSSQILESGLILRLSLHVRYLSLPLTTHPFLCS